MATKLYFCENSIWLGYVGARSHRRRGALKQVAKNRIKYFPALLKQVSQYLNPHNSNNHSGHSIKRDQENSVNQHKLTLSPWSSSKKQLVLCAYRVLAVFFLKFFFTINRGDNSHLGNKEERVDQNSTISFLKMDVLFFLTIRSLNGVFPGIKKLKLFRIFRITTKKYFNQV